MLLKTAIVTGGGTGIGKACAIALNQQGYNVVICYNKSEIEATQLSNSLNNSIIIKADLNDENQINNMVAQTIRTFGTVEVLVNNAGISEQKMFCDITCEDWDNMFNTNVRSMFLTSKAVLPYMINKKFGKIINISSMWGQVGSSCEVHYSASKSAIIGFTKALAKEVGLSNINVNCIAPGVIKTDMNNNLLEETISALKDETPLNRIGTPENIADMVVFLSEEKSNFITGQIIGVNGGMVI